MLSKGISAYVGMGYTIESNRHYLRLARQYGFTRLFTSLHIPEADEEILLEEFHALVGEAVNLGFQITADISPKAFTLLQAGLDHLESLRRLGLTGPSLGLWLYPGGNSSAVQRERTSA